MSTSESASDPRRTTGEAARLLGVSFITVKRWLYSGKIRGEKDPSGKWLISDEEIRRVQQERQPKIDDRILEIVTGKSVAYLRELQVVLEEEYLHEETYGALKRLTSSTLGTMFDGRNRWYFPRDKQWNDVASTAKEKAALAKIYIDHPRMYNRNGIFYADYSEYLVERALIHAGYVVLSKDTYYFNGRVYRPSTSAGRPTDLDFIAYLRDKDTYVGIQVKNKLEHPTFVEVSTLLEICHSLGVRPVLIGRIMHPLTFDLLKSNRGRALRLKRYLLQPPFPRDKFQEIVAMGIPLGVYQWPPDFLVQLLLDLKASI